MAGGVEIALWLLLGIAAATDLISGKVYNAVTFSFLVAGLAYQISFQGSDYATGALMAVGAAFLFYFPLYLIKVFAAGDVKLLMAVGAWSDVNLVIRMGIAGILIGAAVGGIVLFRTTGVVAGVGRVWAEAKAKGANHEGLKMPFAPAFLCAFAFLKIAEYYQWL